MPALHHTTRRKSLHKVTSWLYHSKERGVRILQLIVPEQEDFHIKRNNHSRGVDPIRQTERRGVPYLLDLHLWCVYHFRLIILYVLCRWLVLQTVHHFLSTIMITFDALQKSDGHVSQQLDNLNRLADDLVLKCGATVDDSITSPDDVASVMDSGIRTGPYTITVVKLKEYILSMGISALEVFESLSQGEKNAVLRAVSILHLIALNGIMQIKVERNCYDQESDAVPAYTPLKLVQTSAVDFVHVVRKHKPRILHSFDEQMLAEITDQQQLLAQAVTCKPRLKAALEKASSGSFNKVWAPVGGERFSSLCLFCSG